MRRPSTGTGGWHILDRRIRRRLRAIIGNQGRSIITRAQLNTERGEFFRESRKMTAEIGTGLLTFRRLLLQRRRHLNSRDVARQLAG